jgi:hypothetical protein
MMEGRLVADLKGTRERAAAVRTRVQICLLPGGPIASAVFSEDHFRTMSGPQAGSKGGGAAEIIQLIYGAPELGGFRLIDPRLGQALITMKACGTWGEVAAALGQSWTAFATEHQEQLDEWSAELNGEEPISADTPLDPEVVLDVFQVLVGPLPDAAAAYQLMNEIRGDRSVTEKVVTLAELGGGAPGAPFDAIILDSDESIAAFQQVLEEYGYGHIRLVRDDEFVRRVFM